MSGRIRVGTVVRLKRGIASKGVPRQWTRVRSKLSGIEGGLWLDDALEGLCAWNVEDLERVPCRKGRKK